jgi:ribosomal protein S18 acetylase RimI-like enzyme
MVFREVLKMQKTEERIHVVDAPDIPGLTFRHFRGEVDYPAMVAVIQGSKDADGIERVDTVEEIARYYAHLQNCDPYRDMIFAEMNGKVIGYGRVWWAQEANGEKPYIYRLIGWVLPEWRGRGIGTAMLRWQEARLREIARSHAREYPRFYESWAADTEKSRARMFEREGYQPVTYTADMVRPHLEDIPDLPLPEGIEVRPVQPEHYRAIWEHDKEAFRDHWGYSEDELSYEQFIDFPPYQDPSLWRVAWHGDQIVGQVLSFIVPEENEAYGRKRGYTEAIAVRREYRRRGIASALIALSLRALKERGMEEAALGVHTENLTGAFQLYEKMGYRVVKLYTFYRKPFEV